MEPLALASGPGPRRRLIKLRSLEVAALVHTLAAAWFLRVFCWHLTPAAAALPGAVGFGWFVRYLTFWSFTAQTAALVVAAVDDHVRLLTGRRASRFSQLADDLSSALFALAHVVTIMFYTIQSATKAMVEGDVERPPWLNSSVHLYNTGAAWADMLTSHRSFSRRSEQMSSVLIFAYLAYMQLCRYMNGRFPYPFLNKMRQPHGFVGTVAGGLLLFAGAFRVGRAINRRVRAVSVSIAEEGDTITIEAVKVPRPSGLRQPSASSTASDASAGASSGGGAWGGRAGRWRAQRLTSLGGAVYVSLVRRSRGGRGAGECADGASSGAETDSPGGVASSRALVAASDTE